MVSSLRDRVGETKFVVKRSRHCDANEGFKGFETLQPKMPIQVRPVKPVVLASLETRNSLNHGGSPWGLASSRVR